MICDKIRILTVEDDPDFTTLILEMIGRQADMEVVGCCAGREEAVAEAKRLLPDIVLMDLNLSPTQLDGVDAAREIRIETETKVILLTAFENPRIVTDACRRAFASGYVFKSQFSFLAETIRKTANGHTPQEHLINSLILAELSPAERSILAMMMGSDLHLQSSQKTISNQKTSILKKLGLKSQKDLLHIFREIDL